MPHLVLKEPSPQLLSVALGMERIFGVGTVDWGGGRGIGGVVFGYGEREKGGWNRWCAVEVERLELVVLILVMEREREKGGWKRRRD